MTPLVLALGLALSSAVAPAEAPAGAPPGPSPQPDSVAVYVKYTYRYVSRLRRRAPRQTLLILFPDGTAANRLPSGTVPALTVRAFRDAWTDEQEGWYLGTWRVGPDGLALTFKGETRVLAREPRGWSDPDGRAPSGRARGVFFPGTPLTADDLAGPWEATSVRVAGLGLGGSSVATSSAQRTFFRDGTFGATSQQSYRASIPNGAADDWDVDQRGESASAGRWSLDGLVLTLEADGERVAVPAFRLPHWGDGGPDGDVWIGRGIWSRPGVD